MLTPDLAPPPVAPAPEALFPRLGRWAYRRRRAVLWASGALFVLSLAGVVTGGRLANVLAGSTEAGRALTLVQKELPQAGGHAFTLVLGSKDLSVTDARFRAAAEAALAPARADGRVQLVQTPWDAPEPVRRALMGADGRHALVNVTLGTDPREASLAFGELRPKLRSDTLTLVATGELATDHDFDTMLFEDLKRVEYVALPLALLVLVLVFRSLVASLLPVGVAGLAVLGGLAGVFALNRVMNVSQYALNIVSMVGLGVAIDYSLFIVTRFREELAAGASVEDAVAVAVGTAGRAVLFSGVAVVVGLGGLLFFHGIFLDTVGLAGSLVVALAVLYALTFLPALLGVLGTRVDAGRLPLPRALSTDGLWHRIAVGVMRRPVVVLVPTLAVLVLAGWPFGRVQLAASDVNILPHHAESRHGRELLVRHFGEDPTPLLVVAHFTAGSPLTRARIEQLHAVGRRIAALPRVARVQSVVSLPELGAEEHTTLLTMPRLMMPRDLRDAIDESVGESIVLLAVNAARGATPTERMAIARGIRGFGGLAGGELLVTGLTAIDLDYSDYIRGRVPVAVGFVMAATAVILFLLLGSVLLPLKAVVMNLLSLTASFGALVWIFQDGHLARVLHFVPAPIEPALPIVLFCLIFGLSMDYEVFLLTRMQEEWARSGDNGQAVATGLERSGRLITSAAGIMVLVFAAFAFASIVPIKALGISMALAIALDATIVRMLVVPATMRLLGHLNWWAPAPLARLYRRIGLGEARD
ncbi:MAG TPA: MMPL family transporter [Polyangia bacterium]